MTIPDKPAFKASEVCELAQIQPYVLRSWESEFPELGLSKTPGGPRIYRRTDVERVLRIRDLVFTEGLTLSGVRRRFDAEQPQPQDDLFSFVAEVQAAQAKAAQANAERRPVRPDEGATANTEAPHVEAPAAGTDAAHPARRGAHAKTAAAAAQPELPGHGDADVPAVAAPAAAVPEETRATIVQLKQDMQSLLDLLGGDASAAPPPRAAATPRRGKRG